MLTTVKKREPAPEIVPSQLHCPFLTDQIQSKYADSLLLVSKECTSETQGWKFGTGTEPTRQATRRPKPSSERCWLTIEGSELKSSTREPENNGGQRWSQRPGDESRTYQLCNLEKKKTKTKTGEAGSDWPVIPSTFIGSRFVPGLIVSTVHTPVSDGDRSSASLVKWVIRRMSRYSVTIT